MKVLKQVKSLAVCALVACGAIVSAQATWHHVGSQLQSDSGWKINVNTSAAGPLTINNDCHVAHPETPDYIESNGTETYLLDLSEPIDDGSYIVGTGAYSFRRTGFPFLHKVVFPDTLKTIPSGAAILFGSQSYLKEITPCFPVSLTSYDNRVFDIDSNMKQDLFFLNEAFASLPKQGIKGWKGTNVYFGVGMSSFGNYLFQSRGNPTRFYFFGDYPTSYGDNFTSQQGCSNNGMLLCYPKGNTSWEAFLAGNARAPTESEITSTQAFYPDVTPTAIVTNGVWKSIGNKARVVAWDPWEEKEWLRIEGTEGNVMGGQNLVKPEYGTWGRSQFDGPVTCTAPSVKCTHQGDDYVCKGYSLQRYVDGVWQEFAKGDVNSVQIDDTVASGQSIRLIWQWVSDRRYRLDLHEDLLIEGGVTLTVSPQPDEEGLYAAGTVVTLTANDGTAEGWGAFGAWQGDVGTENKWAGERVLEVPMDAHKSIYCFQRWALSGNTITDGRWTLACSANSAKEITISSDCVRTKGNIPTIDLKKPVADGCKIVQINAYAFRSDKAGQSYSTFYFPDTVRTINNGNATMFAGVNVSSVYNTFPDCLESFGGGMGGVASGFKSDPVIKLLNKNLTTIPRQMFGMCNGGHTYHLGVGFTAISDYGFDCNSSGGKIGIYLYGDTKPSFGSSWHRGSDAVRLVVPKTSADWKAWIAAGNVTPADANSTATYNSTFPKQEPGEKFIGVCKNVDGLNGVYLCTWPSPAAKQFKILLK